MVTGADIFTTTKHNYAIDLLQRWVCGVGPLDRLETYVAQRQDCQRHKPKKRKPTDPKRSALPPFDERQNQIGQRNNNPHIRTQKRTDQL